jgi:hypothetical protein
MAIPDLDDAYKSADNKLKAVKSFKNVKDDYKNLKQGTADNLEQAKKNVVSTLGEVKESKKRFQREVRSQFDRLLDLSQSSIDDFKDDVNKGLSKKSKPSTVNYLKKNMVQAIKKIQPEVGNILFEEILHAVGCSHDQTYKDGVDIYIRVQSIDLYEKLKLDPEDPAGKTLFEKKPISVGMTPFSMNRELYKRVQNVNTSFSQDYNSNYIGKSGQEIFDITYVTMNGLGETGDFFKVTLKPRFSLNDLSKRTNKVGDLLKDYYSTIQIVDFTNIFSNLLDALTGMVSISVNVGVDKLEDQTKFSLLLQRVLGLCFDSKSEIDVSGVAKVAELDGFDDSFFEFNEIDLRNVDQQITNIKNGVVEYETCGDVKLPVNWSQLLDAVNQLNLIDDGDQDGLDTAADNLTNVISENPQWALLLPNSVDIKATINVNFIKELPKAFITTLLSPKILLPLFVILEAIQQLPSAALNNVCKTQINSLQDFFKCFKSFVKNLVSKIGSLFVRELFELIKKDIVLLISSIIIDIKKEKLAKKYAIILRLIQILLIVVKLVDDWRRCKSVIDELLSLLNVAIGGFGNIPLPLLAASQLLGGYSASNAMINTVEEMQSIGLPTGAMPDGSPNLMLASMFSQMKGQDKEQAENGKVQIFAKPLAVSPAGFTKASSIFGKSM